MRKRRFITCISIAVIFISCVCGGSVENMSKCRFCNKEVTELDSKIWFDPSGVYDLHPNQWESVHEQCWNNRMTALSNRVKEKVNEINEGRIQEM